MKDDDLRAMFGSADADKNHSSATEETPVTAPTPEAEAGETAAADAGNGVSPGQESPQSFRVPSFDELMGFAPPAAAQSQAPQPEVTLPEEDSIFSAPASPSVSVSPSALAEPATPAPDLPPPTTQSSPTSENDLAPLVLPGFSPEPQRREPLPPLFQADQGFAGAATRDAEAPAVQSPVVENANDRFNDDFDALPPTQPIDAVTSEIASNGAVQSQVSEEPAADTSDGFAALGLGGLEPKETPEPVTPAPSPRVAGTTPNAVSAAPLAATEPIRRRSNAMASGPGDDYEKISVTGGEGGRRRALPWIIVGGGVLIALIASMFVINALRSPSSEPSPSPVPTVTTDPTEEPTPEPTATPTPTPEPEPTDVPAVEVGAAWWIPITQWNLDVEKSQRLGTVTYSGLTDESLTLEIELAASLPEACAAQRTGWGLTKNADGTLEAVRPTPRCADASGAAVYDTIWGLVDHMAKSARVSE